MPDRHDSNLDAHWQYAFGSAIRDLQRWIQSFSFSESAQHHAYADSDPNRALNLIEAFLADESTTSVGGNRRDLKALRDYVKERVIPIYDRGLEAGRAAYPKHGNRGPGFSTQDLQKVAWAEAAQVGGLRDWFVEGYCVGYSYKEVESIRREGA